MGWIKICVLKQKQKTQTTFKILYLAIGKKEEKKFSDLLGHKEHQPQRIYTKSFAARGLTQLPSDLITILPILKLAVILSEKKPSKILQKVISCLLWFILSKTLNI